MTKQNKLFDEKKIPASLRRILPIDTTKKAETKRLSQKRMVEDVIKSTKGPITTRQIMVGVYNKYGYAFKSRNTVYSIMHTLRCEEKTSNKNWTQKWVKGSHQKKR